MVSIQPVCGSRPTSHAADAAASRNDAGPTDRLGVAWTVINSVLPAPCVPSSRAPTPTTSGSKRHTHGVSHEAPFDPSPYAIPVGYASGGEFTAGTGFLGRSSGVVSFYTAAHNLYGYHPVATPGWDGWHKQIGVYLHPDEPALALEAFSIVEPTTPGVIAGTFPLFSWAPDPMSQYMRDAVRFRHSDASPVLAACVERYAVVEFDDLVPAEGLTASDRLSCAGYPVLASAEQTVRWPYLPPERLDGYFLRVNQRHVQATMASQKGFSGGPVFTEAGRFAGMVVGTNPEPGYPHEIARIVTAQDVASL